MTDIWAGFEGSTECVLITNPPPPLSSLTRLLISLSLSLSGSVSVWISLALHKECEFGGVSWRFVEGSASVRQTDRQSRAKTGEGRREGGQPLFPALNCVCQRLCQFASDTIAPLNDGWIQECRSFSHKSYTTGCCDTPLTTHHKYYTSNNNVPDNSTFNAVSSAEPNPSSSTRFSSVCLILL